MKTAKDIIREKGTTVYTVKPDETVFRALQILAEENIGALIVTDDQEAVIGIISERDYARKVILQGMSSTDTLVSSIMTDKVCYAHPNHSVEECLALMTATRCRHLPIIENGELKGLVSIGDLVKATIAEKEFLIDQLKNYIQLA